jgi:UDP-glucuronate decarboxylase
VIDITGSKSKIVERPLPEDDPKQRQPNIDLAEKLLGWHPTINLNEGLKRTVAYFEALLREHGKTITSDKRLQSAASA